MDEKPKYWPHIGVTALTALLVCEIFTNILFPIYYPGYNWKTQSISYLGQDKSPILQWVKIWSISFSVGYTIFAFAFYYTFKNKGWLIGLASLLLIIYGLGEGIGSGFFPVSTTETTATTNAFLHNFFGGLADISLFTFPVILLKTFPFSGHKNLWTWTLVTYCLSLLFCSFFLIAKYQGIQSGFLLYKGLWQRMFVLCFYLYFFQVGRLMITRINS
jgi:hypothetical protein